MTDTKPDNKSDGGSATQQNKPASKQPKTPAAGQTAKPARRTGLFVAILILLLVAAGLAATVWYQHRTMHERADALLGQAQQSSRDAQAAAGQANQALTLARQQTQYIDQMRTELDDARQHLQSLEQALQMLTDSGTDIALINDMDHLVSIAHQQLLLGGNVSNAIIALETAQAQLARANRSSLASLQQAINGDVERLRAVATVDINRLSSRIDELGRLIESAPLLIPDDAAPTVPQSATPAKQAPAPALATQDTDPSDPWWKQGLTSATEWSRQTWVDIKHDLGSFINVRRVDDAAALLMSPEQAGSLRDKLRLRLMTAQLALLMKQPDVWATETRAIVQLLQARYDVNSVEGNRALRLALQLADTSIQVELPTVANSQNAIQALREEHARSSQSGANGSETSGQTPDGNAEQADGNDNADANGNGGGAAEPAEAPANGETNSGTGTEAPGTDVPADGTNGRDTQSGPDTQAPASPSEGDTSDSTETPASDDDSAPATASARVGAAVAEV